MKRAFTLLLILAVGVNLFPVSCSAISGDFHDQSLYYTDDYYEHVYTMYCSFMNGKVWNDYLINDKKFVYPQVKAQLEDNDYFQFCFSAVEFLTEAGWVDVFTGNYDEYDIKVQYYVSALCSLLMTMGDNFSDVKATQAKADATMEWSDYLIDGAFVTAGILSSATKSVWKAAFTTCGISIDMLDDTISTLESYQALEVTSSIYLMYHSLLEVITRNSRDIFLTQAAQYLLKATDLCFAYRMKNTNIMINGEFDAFFSVLEEVMEQAEQDVSTLSGELAALNSLNKIAKNIGSFKLGVDIGEWILNVSIHSSNIILRYYEMCAMASVRETLITEIVTHDSYIVSHDDWERISFVQDLLVDLLYVNVRGEYCAYRLLTKDAGLLNVIFNGQKSEEWFANILKINYNLQSTINDFFPNWENFRRNVETGYVSDAYNISLLYPVREYDPDTRSSVITRYDSADFHIPKVNFFSDNIQKVNSEIYDKLYLTIQNSATEIEEYEFPFTSSGITYKWSVNNDVLSLVICDSNYPDYGRGNEYMVYNISISTETVISNNEDIIRLAGLSLEEYYQKAEQVLGSYFWTGWERTNENFQDSNFVNWFNDALQKTISQENIKQSIPYINGDGQLCIIAKIYSLADAEYYWYDLNMINFPFVPDYAQSVTPLISTNEPYIINYQTIRFANSNGSGDLGLSIENNENAVIIWFSCWLDGVSSSVEDFCWVYQEGVNQYTIVGNRSKTSNYMFTLDFQNRNVVVEVVRLSDPYSIIPEGTYYFILEE